MYYYSITIKGFYNSDDFEKYQEAGTLPADLVAMADTEYELFWNPPEGKYMVFDDNGPHLADIPPPDYVAIAEKQRDSLLSEMQTATYTLSMKLNLGRTLTDDEKATLNAWLGYADALNALDLSPAPNITWPDKPNQ